MNIAIDVLAILGPDSKNRGIGNYNTSQFNKLFEKDKENNYFLINFYENVELKNILNYSNNVREFYFYLGPNGLLTKNKDFKGIIGDLVKRFIKENNIEVFYITSPFDRNMSYEMEWFDNVKVVATVYDIIPYLFKKRYLSDKKFYDEYMNWVEKVRKVDKILAISQSVKDDLVKNFHIESGKIEIIYAGTDDWFKKINVTEAENYAIRSKYNIKQDYIMCTGGDDDRKNIAELIYSYSQMPRKLIDRYQLVIACKLSSASEERYYNLAKKNGIEGRVILTNFVPLNELISLYNLAHILAFPSQYEGFGLPIVEAMACGTPVITSNNSSLAEIAEGAAVLVDPFDSRDITRGLIEILEKTDLDELINKGFERVRRFTWDKVADDTLNALTSLKEKKAQYEITGNKNKIAFFTPLPPLESGIADYSVDIIKGLSDYFEIDIYIDKNYKPIYEFDSNVKVHVYESFITRENEYQDIIYQMGNSEYHAYMIDFIQKSPGTLVLHDYNLHGLIYHLTAAKGDFKAYKQILLEDYDKEITETYVGELVDGRGNPQLYDLPLNGVVTNYSKKIIVHSDYSKKLLLEKNVGHKVNKIHHYARIKKQNKVRTRAKLNISTDSVVISAFGHIHETKRVFPILNAFKQLAEEFGNLYLYFVGKPAPHIKGPLTDFLTENNLTDKVIITGYSSHEIFEDYMDTANICLNLRFPYNGETSGSLMRMLGKGKCVLVNDLGSFSEVPDDACVKLTNPKNLSVTEESNMIYKKLKELINDPGKTDIISRKAIEYAENHLNLELISKKYTDFLKDSSKSLLNDQLLDILIFNLNRDYSDKEVDFYELAKTLSFSKM